MGGLPVNIIIIVIINIITITTIFIIIVTAITIISSLQVRNMSLGGRFCMVETKRLHRSYKCTLELTMRRSHLQVCV